jgi:hypothetical protein
MKSIINYNVVKDFTNFTIREEAKSMGQTAIGSDNGKWFKEDVDYRKLQKWQGCASTSFVEGASTLY